MDFIPSTAQAVGQSYLNDARTFSEIVGLLPRIDGEVDSEKARSRLAERDVHKLINALESLKKNGKVNDLPSEDLQKVLCFAEKRARYSRKPNRKEQGAVLAGLAHLALAGLEYGPDIPPKGSYEAAGKYLGSIEKPCLKKIASRQIRGALAIAKETAKSAMDSRQQAIFDGLTIEFGKSVADSSQDYLSKWRGTQIALVGYRRMKNKEGRAGVKECLKQLEEIRELKKRQLIERKAQKVTSSYSRQSGSGFVFPVGELMPPARVPPSRQEDVQTITDIPSPTVPPVAIELPNTDKTCAPEPSDADIAAANFKIFFGDAAPKKIGALPRPLEWPEIPTEDDVQRAIVRMNNSAWRPNIGHQAKPSLLMGLKTLVGDFKEYMARDLYYQKTDWKRCLGIKDRPAAHIQTKTSGNMGMTGPDLFEGGSVVSGLSRAKLLFKHATTVATALAGTLFMAGLRLEIP